MLFGSNDYTRKSKLKFAPSNILYLRISHYTEHYVTFQYIVLAACWASVICRCLSRSRRCNGTCGDSAYEIPL